MRPGAALGRTHRRTQLSPPVKLTKRLRKGKIAGLREEEVTKQVRNGGGNTRIGGRGGGGLSTGVCAGPTKQQLFLERNKACGRRPY